MHALCFLLFSSIFISTIPLLFFVLQTCVLRLLACISFKEMINLGVWTKRVFSFGMVSAFTACTQELVLILVFSCWGIKIVTARDVGFCSLIVCTSVKITYCLCARIWREQCIINIGRYLELFILCCQCFSLLSLVISLLH